MPFNHEAMARRRRMLGMTQQDLAITSGLSLTTIGRIEINANPANGSRMGIDVLQRIAEALHMAPTELLIAPTGNRYERSVQFAANQQSEVSSPKLHDRRRTVMADGYRKLTKGYSAQDTFDLIDREEPDATPEPDREDADHGLGISAAETFLPDPSTE